MVALFAFIICIMYAIYWAIAGNVALFLLDLILALINVPIMVEWLQEKR